jgi:hypothetical protein
MNTPSKYETHGNTNEDLFFEEPDHETAHINKQPPKWTLELAIAFARQIEAILCRSTDHPTTWSHVGLSGGVLRNGSSGKDLDLVIFPHTSGAIAFDNWRNLVVQRLNTYLVNHYKYMPLMLCEYGAVSQDSVAESEPIQDNGRDAKPVYTTQRDDGRRIDFFLLSQ